MNTNMASGGRTGALEFFWGTSIQKMYNSSRTSCHCSEPRPLRNLIAYSGLSLPKLQAAAPLCPTLQFHSQPWQLQGFFHTCHHSQVSILPLSTLPHLSVLLSSPPVPMENTIPVSGFWCTINTGPLPRLVSDISLLPRVRVILQLGRASGACSIWAPGRHTLSLPQCLLL